LWRCIAGAAIFAAIPGGIFAVSSSVSAVSAAGPPLQISAQVAAQPVSPRAKAVVNFAELARQGLSSQTSVTPGGTRVIHSPMAPPRGMRKLPAGLTPAPAVLPYSQSSPSAPSAASPVPAANFIGLDDIASLNSPYYMMIPPDTDGAVGLNHIVTVLNNNIRILTKSSGETVSTAGLGTFWAPVAASESVFDPRTLYDPYSQRWILCVVHGAGAADSSIDIAVSLTSDPTGSYYEFTFPVDSPDGANWGDFPTIGFNKNWVAINVNLFNNTSGYYENSKMLVLEYAKLKNGTLTTGSYFSGDPLNPPFTGPQFCASPVATYSATEEALYIPTHWNEDGYFRLDSITGTGSAPVYNTGTIKSRGIAWAWPFGNLLPQAAPLSGTSACGSTPCPIETQDDCIRSTPVLRSGKIYYAQTVGLPSTGLTHTGVQWTVLEASTANVLDGGRIEDSTATATNGGFWYAYPHIAVNQYGDMILGFTRYSSAGYPSAAYAVHKRTDGAGVMNDPYIYKAGEDYYHKTYSGNQHATGRNRWGDYSKAQVDPANDNDLWVLNEYSKTRVGSSDLTGGGGDPNTSRWGTWWARVTFSSSEATISSFGAEVREDGTFIQWRTGMEAGNLGFNLYRDEGPRMVRLNSSILAGSALVTGNDTVLRAGLSYSWLDREGKADSRYWIEDVNLAGGSTWHGPVSSVPGIRRAGPVPRAASPLLQESGVSSRSVAGVQVSQSAGLPALSADRLAVQSALAGGGALKISVREQGWYQITKAELAAAGFDTRLDPRNYRIYVDGREIAIRVRGEEDGRFDAGDTIGFYGVGLDIPSSDRRLYWLTAGNQPGKRIASARGGGRGSLVSSLDITVRDQERSVYIAAIRNGEGENFFGPVINSSGLSRRFVLPNPDDESSGQARIEIRVQGVTQEQHKIRVSSDDYILGDIEFAGQSPQTAVYLLPAARIHEHFNGLRLTAQSGNEDISVLDSILITYPHNPAADGDSLRFSLEAGQTVSIEGFSNPAIRVMDVTDPDNVTEWSGEAVPAGAGYSLKITAAGRGQRSLLAFPADRFKQPVSMVLNKPSTLRRPDGELDMVIISHPDFMPGLEPLRVLRTGQGLKTAVIDAEDIYDEFSYGHKTPRAIREFLEYASLNWRKSPRYVLLVGDASFDPRNYLGKGENDWIPARMMDTGTMETASEDWFVDFAGDGKPRVAIGRLPARTAAEAARMVDKILQYERSGSKGGALLVSDIGDSYDFKGSNAILKGLASSRMPVEEIIRGSGETTELQKQMIDGLNQGKQIVAYMGHGSVDIWRGNFFTSSDASNLVNAQNLPIVAAVTCLNGYFLNPDVESIGEALLRAEHGGAVAVWSSTGVTDPEGQSQVALRMYDLLLNSRKSSGEALTLGEAIVSAKAAVEDSDVRRTYILLGDPAMRLR
jgi:hypothetical protein